MAPEKFSQKDVSLAIAKCPNVHATDSTEQLVILDEVFAVRKSLIEV